MLSRLLPAHSQEGIIVDGSAEWCSLWKMNSTTIPYSPMSPGLLGKATDRSISTTSWLKLTRESRSAERCFAGTCTTIFACYMIFMLCLTHCCHYQVIAKHFKPCILFILIGYLASVTRDISSIVCSTGSSKNTKSVTYRSGKMVAVDWPLKIQTQLTEIY